MHSSVHVIDYVVLVCYLVLMAGIGAYFMRFMRVGADFLKGGNRVEWWVAGMASFMSGFSVWTFTGGAGFAYRQGFIGVFLMFLAVPAFFFGYIFFAQAWRRSRVTTVVEYIRSRFGEGTHKMFSWLTGPSQLMFGSVRLFALSSFMSVALGLPVEYLVVICGLVVLAYTVLGGYWAGQTDRGAVHDSVHDRQLDLLPAAADRARGVTRSGHGCEWSQTTFGSSVHRDGSACVAAGNDRSVTRGDARVLDGFIVRAQPHHHRNLCEGSLSRLFANRRF
jgi:hypothetical protein